MMHEIRTFDRVLAFAIEREVESEAFYRCLANQAIDSAVSDMLLEFAEEEALHKEKLVKVKNGQRALLTGRPVPRFHTPIDVSDVQPRPNMDLKEALAFAIKKEKAAYRMYLDLAVDAPGEPLMELFLSLAREEANHKVRFEIEYDDIASKEKKPITEGNL